MGSTTSVNWTDVVVAIAAIWGAITGTVAIGAQFVQWYQSRRRVNVQIRLGFLGNRSGVSDTKLFLIASNPSDKVVTLSSCGFLLPSGMQMSIMQHGGETFPCELLPGKGCQIWLDVKVVAESLTEQNLSGKLKLLGFYRDELDTMYKSKPYKFDVMEWMKPS